MSCLFAGSAFAAAELTADFSAAEGYSNGPLRGQAAWKVKRDSDFEVNTELGCLNYDTSTGNYTTAIHTVPLLGSAAIVLEADLVFRSGMVSVGGHSALFRIGLSSQTTTKLKGITCQIRQVKSSERMFDISIFYAPSEVQRFPAKRFKPSAVGIETSTDISQLLTLRFEAKPVGDGLWGGVLSLRDAVSGAPVVDLPVEWKPEVSWANQPKYVRVDSGNIETLGDGAAVNVTRIHVAVAGE